MNNDNKPFHDDSLFAARDEFRDLTSYESAVLRALPANVYTGTRVMRTLPPRQGIGIGRVGELPRRVEPDQQGTGPLQAVVARRRAKNRVARNSRRINRIRGVR